MTLSPTTLKEKKANHYFSGKFEAMDNAEKLSFLLQYAKQIRIALKEYELEKEKQSLLMELHYTMKKIKAIRKIGYSNDYKYCACGCGEIMKRFDYRDRERTVISGHHLIQAHQARRQQIQK